MVRYERGTGISVSTKSTLRNRNGFLLRWLFLAVARGSVSAWFHRLDADYDNGDASGVYAGPNDPYLFGRIRVTGPDPEHRS
jgi:hypothetical protein